MKICRKIIHFMFFHFILIKKSKKVSKQNTKGSKSVRTHRPESEGSKWSKDPFKQLKSENRSPVSDMKSFENASKSFLFMKEQTGIIG